MLTTLIWVSYSLDLLPLNLQILTYTKIQFLVLCLHLGLVLCLLVTVCLWEHSFIRKTLCSRLPLPALYLASRLCMAVPRADATSWSLHKAHTSHTEGPCPPLNTVSLSSCTHCLPTQDTKITWKGKGGPTSPLLTPVGRCHILGIVNITIMKCCRMNFFMDKQVNEMWDLYFI